MAYEGQATYRKVPKFAHSYRFRLTVAKKH